MSELVESLRNYIHGEHDDYVPERIKEAADRIEQLEEQLANANLVARHEAALRAKLEIELARLLRLMLLLTEDGAGDRISAHAPDLSQSPASEP